MPDEITVDMKNVLRLASEGRITLQIPCYEFGIDNNSDTRTVPSKYFMKVKTTQRVARENESGLLYLSPEGFEYFKKELADCFLNSGIDRGYSIETEEDYYYVMRKELESVKETTEKFISQEKKKIDEISNKKNALYFF